MSLPSSNPLHRHLDACFALLMTLLAGLATSVHANDGKGTESLYEDARARMTSGDYSGAVVQLKVLLQSDNRHLPARLLLGEAYLRIGQGAAAEKELKIALGLGADKYEVFRRLGNALLLQRKYKEILELIDGKEPLGSQHYEIRTLRGRAQYELGNIDAAEQEFKTAHELALRRAEPLLGLALIADARGDHDRAAKILNQALDVAPDNVEAWYQRAEQFRAKGETDVALAAFSKSLTLQPNHMRAHLARANLLITQGDYAKALADAEYVHRAVPKDPEATFLIWQIAMFRGDKAAAKAAGEQAFGALTSVPEPIIMKEPSLLRIASLVSVARRDYERGLRYLQRFVELRPNDHQMRKVLGQIQLQTGDAKAAASTFFELSKVMPRDADVFAALGRSYSQTNRFNEATTAFERAVALAPTDRGLVAPLALSRIGAGDTDAGLNDLAPTGDTPAITPEAGVLYAMLQLKRGNLGEAKTSIEKLAQAFPANPFVLNFYGTVLLKAGDAKGAREKFEKALTLQQQYLAAAYNLAQLDLREQGAPAATKRLQEMLVDDPKFSPAMDLLADIAIAEEKYDDALRWLQKAVAVAPNSAEQQAKLIQLFLRLGRTNEALLAASTLAARDNNSPESTLMLARVQSAAGKHEEALNSLQRAMREAGLNGPLLLEIAAQQVALDDHGAARRTLQKAVAAGEDKTALPALVRLEINAGNSDDAERRIASIRDTAQTPGLADILLGELRLKQGRTKEAVSAYDAAYAAAPNTETVLGLYQAKSLLGEHKAALALLETWTMDHPDQTSAKRTLALGYIADHNLNKARVLHEQLIQENPNDATLLANLARILQLQKAPGARDYAERAVRAAPQWPVGLDTLGWILASEGEFEGSLKYLRDSIARDANPLTRFHLASVLNELGRKGEAKLELKQLLDSDTPVAWRADAQKLYDSIKK